MNCFLLLTAFVISFGALCNAHGLMKEPVNRASRWRSNETAPKDYNDDELYCGGFGIQFNTNGGKCGICGDDFRKPIPRPHEFGGEYGEGVIVQTYKAGDKIPVVIDLHTNHWGDFTWSICNMDVEKETEECFGKNKLKLDDGSEKFVLKTGEDGIYKATLQIPNGLKCEHCVLRWTYKTGNTWNFCGEDGKGAIGCGNQEHFISCSDIAIKA